MPWEEAGRAWGRRASDWAYLTEPSSVPAYDAVLDRLSVRSGSRLLDIACGSGLAAWTARRRGATVAGVDAAEPLIEIARERVPDGDFHIGDMFALPFDAATFDLVTSFNGIWKGCDGALDEAHRVLAPDGLLGLTMWGAYDRLGLLPYFMKLIELSPPDHAEATVDQGETGRPGVIEHMLESAGFDVLERGDVTIWNEWPDLEIATRALASGGPAVPVIANVGEQAFRAAVREALSPFWNERRGFRISSELSWVVAQRR